MKRLQRRPRAARFLVACAAAVLALPPAAALAAPWDAMPAALLPLRLPVADAPGWTLRAEAADFEAVDATPVRGLSGDWPVYRPRAGRNAALQSARLELSAARERWEVGTALRSDILIRGSRGAFDVVHAYKQRETPPDGSRYAADADELGVVWAGLRGARTWMLRPGTDHGVQLTAALSALSVRRVQRAEVRGDVHYSAAAGYAFDAQTLQQDSGKQFAGYGSADATGAGWSSDLGLLWQPTPDSWVNLSAVDLLSRLRVRGVATEQMVVSSSTNSLDANGFLNYKPLLQGRDGASDVSLRLLRKWSASAGTRLGAARVGARWERIGGIDLPALWLALPVADGWTLQLDAETRFRSLGIGVSTPRGALLLRTRSLPVGQSRAIGWQASWQMPL